MILITFLFKAFVDEEDSDDLLSPGTRDTRQLETTFVRYQEWHDLEYIISFDVEASDNNYMILRMIVFMLTGTTRSFAT